MENDKVVNDQLTPGQPSEGEENVEPTTTEEVVEPTQATKAGDKTPPNELLSSLQEERERRRISEIKQKELEEQLLVLTNSSTSTDNEVFSDEGKALQEKFNTRTSALEKQLAEIRQDNATKDLLLENPVLKEHLAEFNEYREDPENSGMNIRTAAKAFLVDKDLVTTKKRTGLEKPTGSSREPSTVGKMTSAEVRKLRETNYKKYSDMVVKDQIQIVD